MKKNVFGILIIVLVIAIIGGTAGVQLWFNSSGIHVLGNEIRVKTSRIGYVINSETGEVLGQSSVNINGATNKSDSELFEGTMSVSGYENTETGTIETTLAIEKTDSGMYLIRKLEKCTHPEKVEGLEGVTQNVEHLCDYYYTYYLDPENEDFLVVLIEGFDETIPLYVVCADSQEAALERYQWFLENDPE